MSQIELEPIGSATTKKPNLAEFSPQSLYDKCVAIARNLWWTWHPEVVNLFRDLDPIRWRQLDHNPIALLAEFTPERLEMRAAELVLYSRINQSYRRLKEYIGPRTTWGTTHAGVLGSKPVAYFSAEFGIHESVPIYSGGLGVLSGDHVKSASGLGVPLVAIGLFYDQGYFKQHLDIDGYQQEEYLDTKVENVPMEPALGTDGRPITVTSRYPHRAAVRQAVADARGPCRFVSVGLRCRRQQAGRPRTDQPAVRRRSSHAHSAGIDFGRWRRESATGAGNSSGRLSPERRAQRVRHA